MGFFKQLIMLIRMSFLGIPQRLGLVLTSVIGITCAVGVLVAMLAMDAGAREEALGNVRPARASVLSKGAIGTMQSSITKDIAPLIQDLPGIRRDTRGRPIAPPQVMVFTQARARGTRDLVGFPMVGMGAGLTEYVPELHMSSGRMFRPGLHELIVSNYCVSRYEQLGVGDKKVIQGTEWLVVGTFDLGRSTGTCTVYADADTMVSAFKRGGYNVVNLMLQSPAAFPELEKALKANPQLQVQVKHEAELAQAGMEQVDFILNFISYFVGVILAIAATIGAANSLYAVVDSRRRDLATLRAVGFGGTPVVLSTLCEAVVLAVPGALIGAGLAWLFFNGRAASPFGFQFHLAVTPSLALVGIVWALVMGLVGGLWPAVQAARVPVAVALRAT